jgi:hypothetical protein
MCVRASRSRPPATSIGTSANTGSITDGRARPGADTTPAVPRAPPPAASQPLAGRGRPSRARPRQCGGHCTQRQASMHKRPAFSPRGVERGAHMQHGGKRHGKPGPQSCQRAQWGAQQICLGAPPGGCGPCRWPRGAPGSATRFSVRRPQGMAPWPRLSRCRPRRGRLNRSCLKPRRRRCRCRRRPPRRRRGWPGTSPARAGSARSSPARGAA